MNAPSANSFDTTSPQSDVSGTKFNAAALGNIQLRSSADTESISAVNVTDEDSVADIPIDLTKVPQTDVSNIGTFVPNVTPLTADKIIEIGQT